MCSRKQIHAPTCKVILFASSAACSHLLFFLFKFEYSDSAGESSFAASTCESTVSVVNNTPANKNKLDEHTPEGKRMIRDEVLRLVTSLSSVVASRSHQEELVK